MRSEKLVECAMLMHGSGRLKTSSPTTTLPCPPSCKSSGAVRAPSPSTKSDADADEAGSSRSESVDPGGTSCCRGMPHVERDRAVSTVARRMIGASAAAYLPPPPPPRRSDWTAWNPPPPTGDDGEVAPRCGELTSTV